MEVFACRRDMLIGSKGGHMIEQMPYFEQMWLWLWWFVSMNVISLCCLAELLVVTAPGLTVRRRLPIIGKRGACCQVAGAGRRAAGWMPLLIGRQV